MIEESLFPDLAEKIFLADICLAEDRQQSARCNLRVVGNRDKPPVLLMKKMDMASGLPDRFELKTRENPDDFRS
jgi:hypothetical protein